MGEELRACPCDPVVTCDMKDPCYGCEKYAIWFSRYHPPKTGAGATPPEQGQGGDTRKLAKAMGLLARCQVLLSRCSCESALYHGGIAYSVSVAVGEFLGVDLPAHPQPPEQGQRNDVEDVVYDTIDFLKVSVAMDHMAGTYTIDARRLASRLRAALAHPQPSADTGRWRELREGILAEPDMIFGEFDAPSIAKGKLLDKLDFFSPPEKGAPTTRAGAEDTDG